MFIQELVQSLQGAFDSSRCVHVVSADCRKERWCGINAPAAPFPFYAGTWGKEVNLDSFEGGRRRSDCSMVGNFMMNIRFFITNFRFLFTSNFF